MSKTFDEAINVEMLAINVVWFKLTFWVLYACFDIKVFDLLFYC